MKEKVVVFGEEVEVEVCQTCNGTGNSIEWDRTKREHVENRDYYCERCKGAKYVVVSKWAPPVKL